MASITSLIFRQELCQATHHWVSDTHVAALNVHGGNGHTPTMADTTMADFKKSTADVTVVGATVSSGPSGGEMTLTGVTGATSSHIGYYAVCTNGSNSANNGTYYITDVPVAGTVKVRNSAGVATGTVDIAIHLPSLFGDAGGHDPEADFPALASKTNVQNSPYVDLGAGEVLWSAVTNGYTFNSYVIFKNPGGSNDNLALWRFVAFNDSGTAVSNGGDIETNSIAVTIRVT